MDEGALASPTISRSVWSMRCRAYSQMDMGFVLSYEKDSLYTILLFVYSTTNWRQRYKIFWRKKRFISEKNTLFNEKRCLTPPFGLESSFKSSINPPSVYNLRLPYIHSFVSTSAPQRSAVIYLSFITATIATSYCKIITNYNDMMTK